MNVVIRSHGSLSLRNIFVCTKRCAFQKAQTSKLKVKVLDELQKIRNIGIIAHIDAGKTTTTERMLYYSGYSNVMGEVHDGDTVMDYMEQERQRGITITSAAITFNWLKHQINLIDTPGHVDFTVEVERSLRVLDGAITILDASAGVEAQTFTVWRQADRYDIPRIAYLNKMDKPKANVDLCLDGLHVKLKSVPLLLHLPLYKNNRFEGVIDLVTTEIVKWSFNQSDNGGNDYSKQPLNQDNKELWDLVLRKREKLVEAIADLDNVVAETVITSENTSRVSVDILQSAIRRITLQSRGVPVLCGSSYRNVGVQLLLDAIISYLPSPAEREHSLVKYFENELCALAFKIIHNKTKGPLTFLRIYSGSLKEGQSVYIVNKDITEKISKVMLAFADDFKEVPLVTRGQIAVISGFNHVITGDTLVSHKYSVEKARKLFESTNKDNSKSGSALLAGIQIADPVFFCSIESHSLSTQKILDTALISLQREDPSLKVSVNPDSGQTIIAGMGELHIDVIRDRIQREYGIEVYLGPLQVSYRETISNSSEVNHVLDKTLGGTENFVSITMASEYKPGMGILKDVIVKTNNENQLDKLRSDHLKAINNGVHLAFMHGPILGSPVIDVKLKLLAFISTNRTSLAMISAATSKCVNILLKASNVVLLEPIMKLEIVTEKKYATKLIEDLQHRRSYDIGVDDRHDFCVVGAKTPLSELRKYSNTVRKFTSGNAHFSMEFDSYRIMNFDDQKKAIQEVTGFAPL